MNAFLGARAPASDIINMFNFPDDVRRSVLNVSLAALQEHLKGINLYATVNVGFNLWSDD